MPGPLEIYLKVRSVILRELNNGRHDSSSLIHSVISPLKYTLSAFLADVGLCVGLCVRANIPCMCSLFFKVRGWGLRVVTLSCSRSSPLPHHSVGRKQEQCVCVWHRGHSFVCVCEPRRSYYIKQDFPECSAAATGLPKSSSGFPPQHKLCSSCRAPTVCFGQSLFWSCRSDESALPLLITHLLKIWER